MKLGFILALSLVSIATACGGPPKEYDEIGRRVLQLAETHDWPALEPLLDPGLTTSTARAQLAALGDSLGLWAPDSVALVGWNVSTVNSRQTALLTYELHGAHGWELAGVGFERREGGPRVNGLQVVPRTQSLASENAFTLQGRSGRHLVFLAALAASVLFSFGSAVVLLRTPMPRRGWLALLSLVSVGAVQLNWSSGEWVVLPAWFTFFGGGIQKAGPVAPWIVSVGLPLGACVALWRRAMFSKERPGPPAPAGSVAQATEGG